MQTRGRAPVSEPPSSTGRTLTSRASLNAVASGLDYGTRALVELLVIPLVVAGLGPAVYGAWRVLWQWSSYVWGASGRSAQALQFAIANRQWTATGLEKRQLVGAALFVWVLFTPLLLAFGALGVWLAPHLLEVSPDQVGPLRVAAAILCLDALVVTVLTLPRSCLVGENLGYTRMGVSALLVAVGGGLLILAVRLDLGLPGIAGATLVTTCLTGAVFWVITRRRVSWFGVSRPPQAVTRWLLGLSVWFLGWKLVLEVMIAGDVLVLAAFAPLSVVAGFALSKWVADSMTQVLSLLVQATIPGIGGYLGAGALVKAAALRAEVLSLVWVLGTAVGGTIVLWNETFIRVWVGGHLFAGTVTTLLVVTLALQLALIRADTFVIDVALLTRVKVVAGAVAAVLSIGVAVLAVGPWDGGVVGLCLGLVAGRSVLSVVAPVAVGRHLGLRPGVQLRGVLRPAAVTAATFAGTAGLAPRLTGESWLELVVGCLVTAPVLGVLVLASGLTATQRTRLLRRARSLTTRRKVAL